MRHGPAERPAYEAQLGALLRLGVAPDSAVYFNVVRAMNVVLKSQAQALAAARLKQQEGSQEGSLASAGRAR